MDKFSPILSCQACPIISQLNKNANCQFGLLYKIWINRRALALKSWQTILVKYTFSFAKFTGDMQRPIRICQIIDVINA